MTSNERLRTDAGAEVVEALYLLRRAGLAMDEALNHVCSLAARGQVRDSTVVSVDTVRRAIRITTEKAEDLHEAKQEGLW